MRKPPSRPSRLRLPANTSATTTTTARPLAGPKRDFIGYGRHAPRISWPRGAALAVNLVIVYEEGSEYSLPAGDGRNDGWGEYNSQVGPEIRDLGTETHYEYGSRTGIWRLVRLLEREAIPATFSATAQALDINRQLVAYIRQAGHDVLGHGLRWTEAFTQTREQERADLKAAVSLYQQLTGEHPHGWNARSFPSTSTFDLIVEEGGFTYYSDPCNDDIPYFVGTANGRMLIVPYSKTYNDSRFLVAPGYANPTDFATDVCAGIDYLATEALELGGRMMTIAVHARWSGQANRASGLARIIAHARSVPGVAFMRRLDIARHIIAAHGDLPTLPLAPATRGPGGT